MIHSTLDMPGPKNPLGCASEGAQHTVGKTGVKVRDSDSAGYIWETSVTSCWLRPGV